MIFKKFVGRVVVSAILACAALPATAKTGNELCLADDLSAVAREGRAQRAPLMIVFTQAGCVHCAAAKRDYLAPMNRSATLRGKVIIREIDVDSRARLRDFDGRTISHKAFSRRYQVRRVPTVIVMDGGGKSLAPPVVGLLADDFYGLYLQQAIDEGRIKMQAARK